jgi:hypothetical protein
VSVMNDEPKFKEQCMEWKRNEAALKNAPKEVSETNYFLAILERAVLALTTQFKQMEEYINCFCLMMSRNITRSTKMIQRWSIWGHTLPCLMENPTTSTVWTSSLNLQGHLVYCYTLIGSSFAEWQ